MATENELNSILETSEYIWPNLFQAGVWPPQKTEEWNERLPERLGGNIFTDDYLSHGLGMDDMPLRDLPIEPRTLDPTDDYPESRLRLHNEEEERLRNKRERIMTQQQIDRYVDNNDDSDEWRDRLNNMRMVSTAYNKLKDEDEVIRRTAKRYAADRILWEDVYRYHTDYANAPEDISHEIGEFLFSDDYYK